MIYRSGLPWPKINDYIVEVGSERTIQGFTQKALQRIYDLVPFDCSSVFYLGPFKCIDTYGSDQKFMSNFNSHYSFINPALSVNVTTLRWIDWRQFQHTEFVTDFNNPQGVRYSLVNFLPGYPLALSIQRSQKSSKFKDRDYDTLRNVTAHLNNIFSYLQAIRRLSAGQITAAEMVKGSRLLSKREAEVATLLCQRLTAAEIATKLLISRRTVEFHITNIFEKLKVRTRRDLVQRILGESRRP